MLHSARHDKGFFLPLLRHRKPPPGVILSNAKDLTCDGHSVAGPTRCFTPLGTTRILNGAAGPMLHCARHDRGFCLPLLRHCKPPFRCHPEQREGSDVRRAFRCRADRGSDGRRATGRPDTSLRRFFAALRMTRILNGSTGPMLHCARHDRGFCLPLLRHCKPPPAVILSNAKDLTRDGHSAAGPTEAPMAGGLPAGPMLRCTDPSLRSG